MLRAFAADATALLLLQEPAPLVRIAATLSGCWRTEAPELLADAEWRAQLVATVALTLGGADAASSAALWRAVDGASWVTPQLVAAAFLVDARFEARAEERLLAVTRRSPKMLGALVRAYHRLPQPRLPVVAQLARHDQALASEEARVGVRSVDVWLDRLPLLCDPATQSRWLRRPRVS